MSTSWADAKLVSEPEVGLPDPEFELCELESCPDSLSSWPPEPFSVFDDFLELEPPFELEPPLLCDWSDDDLVGLRANHIRVAQRADHSRDERDPGCD